MLVPFNLIPEEIKYSSALGTPIGNLTMQYLWLPLTKGCIRNRDWQAVIDKVERQLEGWQSRGRLVLLRSVLSTKPIFYLSIFRLLVGLEEGWMV